ncbi:hypothetical protein [Adonisia turfae]|uniref:Uncharacterized protein n=1 Tax=Adonisia turfae CCMR0081 TaxID=2292702 RepID=A0A6M0RHS0_9CYAN|nr:hypothetical protein [Adonisia turfae]NEZ55470.1 hypothetical protein [Adonisia turfae CCMR0081]
MRHLYGAQSEYIPWWPVRRLYRDYGGRALLYPDCYETELRQQEQAGKPNAKLNSGRAQQRALTQQQ